MIQRLGFFHFPANDGNPIEQLTVCLKQDASVGQGESLIVLPEGFNLLCSYSPPNREGGLAAAEDYRRCLEDLAHRYSITFVVGLIEPRDGESSRRNVAYVVTPSGHSSALCCKMNDDGTGHYQPCRCAVIPGNPHIIGNLALGCLICMDALQQQCSLGPEVEAANQRRTDVLSELRKWAETPGQNALLCVPAAFSDKRNWNNMEELRGMAVIVANASADARSLSVIVSQSCAQVAIRDGAHNHLHLADLDQVFPAALN